MHHAIGLHALIAGSAREDLFILNLRGLLARFEIVLLPFRHFPGKCHFHGRHFIFGTAGGPILKLRGDDVRAGESVMERGVDDARLHALGDASVQCGIRRRGW